MLKSQETNFPKYAKRLSRPRRTHVTYTVPKGGLNVWEGPAASQKLDDLEGYVLEGGGKQIVLDPKQLNAAYVSQRMPTKWGYDSGLNTGQGASLVGIPTLTNSWR